MKKPLILLGHATTHGISKCIAKNLEHCGFNVILLAPTNELEKKFKYPNLKSRLQVLWQKHILKQKYAKVNLQSEIYKKQLIEKLQGDKLDHSVFILAQSFSTDLIQFIKNHTKGNVVNYQWDAIHRIPRIMNYVDLFDRFFVFEKGDLDLNEKFLPSTSFYFDYDLEPLETEFDFYFLGADIPNRRKEIVNFANLAKQNNWNLNFKIFCPKYKNKIRKFYPENIELFDKSQLKGYEHNLNQARRCKVIVDFVVADHKGLSLRVFEALGHNKKLITTNADIVNYDFYHPNNIFVLNNQNCDQIHNFLNSKFVDIDQNIKLKYSFSNWIKYILDIQQYNSINLP